MYPTLQSLNIGMDYIFHVERMIVFFWVRIWQSSVQRLEGAQMDMKRCTSRILVIGSVASRSTL